VTVATPKPSATAPRAPDTSRSIDLRPLFAPRSIALVGASPTSDTVGIFRRNIELIGAVTRLHLVNPKYPAIDDAPCYPNLAALPEVPDIAVLAVGPARATVALREAAALGVPAAIIPGGGVIEGGEPAARMQVEVAAIAAESGLALLGPNCMGVIDMHAPSATYYDDLPALRSGGTVGIAQSGSVTNAFMNAGPRIGWSRLISCGSEVVLDVCDYMTAALDDDVTDSIVLFVEGFKRPERFLALADRALAMDIPVLAVKVGASEQAQAAAVSHSGSLAGDTRASAAALRAAGVIACEDLDELLETAALVSRSRLLGRRVGRGRTAALTVSTGEASLIADLVPRTGLDLGPIPPAARAAIAEALPTLTHIANPLDPWGAGDYLATYRTIFDILADSGAYDVVALVHDFPFGTPLSESELAAALAAELIASTADRPGILPVFASLTSGDPPSGVLDVLDAAGGVPMLRGAVAGFRAIPHLAWWEQRHAARQASGPVRAAWPALAVAVPVYGYDAPGRIAATATSRRPSRVIPERESLELLRAAGIPLIASVAVEGRDPRAMLDAATRAADALGWPVAVKLDAPGLAHKTDIGGVVLGIRNRRELDAALRRVLTAGREHDPDGVLIQPMAPTGVELIVGARRDLQFGALVLVGIGGVLAEVLDDVVLRLAPIDAGHARAMLDELRGARLLDGVRGRRSVNRSAMAELIAALGRALEANPTWREVDINPVIAGREAVAVDALIVADPEDPDWDYEDPGGRADA
jgi:acetate---CoA ligase (ADP-forming)